MKKTKSLMFLLLIFLVSFVSAVTIYSGEPYSLNLDKPYEYYSIVGNSTEVNVEVTQDENNVVTIIPDKYSQTDSYEIIFFDIEKEIIVEYYNSGGGGGGGGGTRTIYRDKNITKYVDKEVEVPGQTITKEVEVEVENIIKRTSLLVWVFIVILLGAVIYLAFFRKQYKSEDNERRYENNE